MLLRLTDWNEQEAARLAATKRYDEIIELRWMKAAETKAQNDYHK